MYRIVGRGQNKRQQEQKNNTRDSNVVPHRSTNLARQCLTSLSRREAVLSLWYGRSCRITSGPYKHYKLHYMYSVYIYTVCKCLLRHQMDHWSSKQVISRYDTSSSWHGHSRLFASLFTDESNYNRSFQERSFQEEQSVLNLFFWVVHNQKHCTSTVTYIPK